MLLKKISTFNFFILFTGLFHLIFYFSFYFGSNILYSGKDSIRLHYASRVFLADSFNQGVFPFWTDKLFGGYPIFFDLERGYQNIFNLVAVYFLGPYHSYNVLFLVTFFLGAISLYLLLKKLYNPNFIIQITAHFLYFYSFFYLLHLQHQNFTFVIHLFPTIILLSYKFISTKNIYISLLVSIIYYFLITFGALQMVMLAFLGQIIYLWVYKNNKLDFINSLLGLVVPSILISTSSLYFFYNLFSISERNFQELSSEGSFNLQYLASYLFPFVLGNSEYLGFSLNSEYFKHEYITYFSTSGLLIIILALFQNKINFSKKIFYGSLICFILLNSLPFFPFDLFRYWARAIFLINFAGILLIVNFLSNLEKIDISKKYILILLGIGLLVAINFLNKDFLFIFKQTLPETYLDLIFLIFVVISTVWLVYKNPKYLPFIVLVELIFFTSRNNFHLFVDKSRVENLRIELNSLDNLDDDYSLLKQGPSLSIYSQTIPSSKDISSNPEIKNKFSLEHFQNVLFLNLIAFIIYLLILYKIKYVFKN